MQPVQYKWIPHVEYSSQQQPIIQGRSLFLDIASSLSTLRQVTIDVQDLAAQDIPFVVTGVDFMNNQIIETVTVTAGQDSTTTVNFYRTIQSITPSLTDTNNEVVSVTSSVIGYTQPYVTDVFNKNALYSYEVGVTIANSDFLITPQYTLSRFSQYNELNNPDLNTTVNNIVWLDLPAATNPPISGSLVENYGYRFSDFPVTALRLNVSTSFLDTNFAFQAKILQQGVWM